MNIISKPVQEKYDPKRPQGHPDYAKAIERAKVELPKMQFHSEAHKRDYMRAVAANPSNLAGMPLFYPALTTTTAVGVALRDCERDGHIWSNTRLRWCLLCDIDETCLEQNK